jgi:thymidylate kinase
MRAEQWYYRHITPPDVVIVLLVDPELAVRRKTNEPPDYVRARARIIWDTDWSETGARVVDAGRPLGEVIADLKSLLWAEI